MTFEFDTAELVRKVSEFLPPGSELVIRAATALLTEAELGGLSPPQLKTWKSLKNPQRKLEWSEARRCEMELRAKLGPKAKTSISHTRLDGVPVVFAIGSSKVNGLGIDVELTSRTVTEGVARRFMSPAEATFNLKPLSVWVIKEAVFKSNPENKETLLPQYQIVSYYPGQNEGLAKIGIKEIGFCHVELSGWAVGVAAC